jgi:hypothetical protein
MAEIESNMASPVSGNAENPISPSRQPISDLLSSGLTEGVVFIAVTDDTGLDVIRSSKNFVDGQLQFKDAMCDSGCAGTLLSFFNLESIVTFMRLYSDKAVHNLSVETAKGAHGDGLVIVATHVDMQGSFQLSIGTDLFPNSRPGVLKRLRFHLSSENAKFIVENYSSHISPTDLPKLKIHQSANIKAHGKSLIGNIFCSQFSEVKHANVRYFLKAAQCPSITFHELTAQSASLLGRLNAHAHAHAHAEMLDFGEVLCESGDY